MWAIIINKHGPLRIFLLQPMQYSPVCGHTGSQCFDEGDRGNWADRWFHGTRVGSRVGHTGPGYPSTRVLTSLLNSLPVPVSYLLMSLHSEGQSLSANQISSRYLHWRLIYNYFRFRNTNVHHIGILVLICSPPLCRNLYVILHQATEFRPNWSTHGENMTSYPFLKMAAVTAKYYFRFRIC